MASSIIKKPGMTYYGWFPMGESLANVAPGIYRTSPANGYPSEGLTPNFKGILIVGGNVNYLFCIYITTSGKMSIWCPDTSTWVAIN